MESLRLLESAKTSSVELVAEAKLSAQSHAALNAIAWVDWDEAHQSALALDAQRSDAANGSAPPLGPLHGIPITIKDLYQVSGTPLRAGTRAALPDLGMEEAQAVQRLRAAGALILAKTNMHEIALGATGENIWTGDVLNPYDPAHQAGGSSSGAAVATAVGIGFAGLGSDTGGSVRIPAAFCGLAGFKPSFGLIPLAGALHLSWTCDHAGPLALDSADCALLYEVMAQRSAAHGTVGRAPRLGIPVDWLAPRLADEVAQAFEQQLASLRSKGAEIRDLKLKSVLDRAWDCYSAIVRPEAAWIHRAALAQGAEGFSDAVLAPMRLGEQMTALQYVDAMQEREAVRRDLYACLADVDALVMPTTAVAAPQRGQTAVTVAGGTISIREAVLGQTAAFSMVGLPALTIPFARSGRLPLGLQIVGRPNADALVLALGKWLETQGVGLPAAQGVGLPAAQGVDPLD
ncbi:MAG: amidase [Betaproteobacteria bacterium]|nr:amidase [Betaproteobacteria bacterium]